MGIKEVKLKFEQIDREVFDNTRWMNVNFFTPAEMECVLKELESHRKMLLELTHTHDYEWPYMGPVLIAKALNLLGDGQ